MMRYSLILYLSFLLFLHTRSFFLPVLLFCLSFLFVDPFLPFTFFYLIFLIFFLFCFLWLFLFFLSFSSLFSFFFLAGFLLSVSSCFPSFLSFFLSNTGACISFQPSLLSRCAVLAQVTPLLVLSQSAHRESRTKVYFTQTQSTH